MNLLQAEGAKIEGLEFRSLAKGFDKLEEQGVKRAYAIFNNCYQNFGIMNATTMAAILRGQT